MSSESQAEKRPESVGAAADDPVVAGDEGESAGNEIEEVKTEDNDKEVVLASSELQQDKRAESVEGAANPSIVDDKGQNVAEEIVERNTEAHDEEAVLASSQLQEEKRPESVVGDAAAGHRKGEDVGEDIKEKKTEFNDDDEVAELNKLSLQEKGIEEAMEVEECEEEEGNVEDEGGLEEEMDEEGKKTTASPASKEPVTPAERPSRERKTVQRYSGPFLLPKSSATKPIEFLQGKGALLKDIPNVAFKLSKRKPDDNLQMLHTILFGKKAKVHNLKRDIGKFSGFVWIDNEEKQRAKTRERLDKCVKEKLLDFCDVLNIPFSKTGSKKEELSDKLLKFLESPCATTNVLLSERKGKKRKSKATPARRTSSSKEATSEKTAKRAEKRMRSSEVENENETEGEDHHSDLKDDSMEEDESDKASKEDRHEENNSVDEEGDPDEHITNEKGLSTKKSGAKDLKSPSEKKSSGSHKPMKSLGGSSASTCKSKGSSGKKQKAEKEIQEEQDDDSVKKRLVKSRAKPATKDKGKGKRSNKAKLEEPIRKPLEPSREKLHVAAVEILKMADFSTVTLNDVMRMLVKQFDDSLLARKAEVREIIADVIQNMSGNEDEEEDEDDEDAEESEEEGEENDDESE